jgi:hypothetical protein
MERRTELKTLHRLPPLLVLKTFTPFSLPFIIIIVPFFFFKKKEEGKGRSEHVI